MNFGSHTYHCNYGDEYETEYSGSIDSETPPSIDIAIHPPIDDKPIESIDSIPANATFTLPAHCYPRFDVAAQPRTAIDYHYGDTISRQGDYSIGSWADDSLHQNFAVDIVDQAMQSDEYDKDYHNEEKKEYCSLISVGVKIGNDGINV